MNAIAATATKLRIPSAPATACRPSILDPLGDDLPTDDVVVTTRRGMIRVALVAAEVAQRFQREGVVHDPMAWMLAPRLLFDGAAALDACIDRDACLRGILLHGLSLGLDARASEIDALVADDDDEEGMVATAPRRERPHAAAGSQGEKAPPLRPTTDPQPRLFTATVVHEDGLEMVHAFHASFATNESEIAERLYGRMGAAASDAAIVRGFDHSSPIVEALVSQAICDTLIMINAEPTSPLAMGLDLNIEQRFLA